MRLEVVEFEAHVRELELRTERHARFVASVASGLASFNPNPNPNPSRCEAERLVDEVQGEASQLQVTG